jgi:hypothetical protein
LKKQDDVTIQVDLNKFRNLSDEEIAEMFNKAVLPEIIKKVRTGGRGKQESECPVCNPWSYSVF